MIQNIILTYNKKINIITLAHIGNVTSEYIDMHIVTIMTLIHIKPFIVTLVTLT